VVAGWVVDSVINAKDPYVRRAGWLHSPAGAFDVAEHPGAGLDGVYFQ